MCECKPLFERAVREKFERDKPTATSIKAEIQGYGINLSGGTSLPALTLLVTYAIPRAKGGGLRPVSEKINAVATFCPFCGERYVPLESAVAAGVEVGP